jgi:hypothetical protein
MPLKNKKTPAFAGAEFYLLIKLSRELVIIPQLLDLYHLLERAERSVFPEMR